MVISVLIELVPMLLLLLQILIASIIKVIVLSQKNQHTNVLKILLDVLDSKVSQPIANHLNKINVGHNQMLLLPHHKPVKLGSVLIILFSQLILNVINSFQLVRQMELVVYHLIHHALN